MAHFGVWFLFALALLAGVSDAAVHDVGGSAAWTVNVNYDKWASSINFHVGDSLVFKYNNQFHNVKQVSHQDYQSCNATAAVAVYSSGSDSVTLKRPGHYYFLCGFPGHCQAGQKVDILVKPSSVRGPGPSPSPRPSQAPQVSPTSGSQSAPGPVLGPKSGSSRTSSPGFWFWFWLVLGVSVARVF